MNTNWDHIVDVRYRDGGELRLYSNMYGTFSLNKDGSVSQIGTHIVRSPIQLAHTFYLRPIESYEIIQ